MKNTIAIIPARWNSSRFPGKSIVDILGIPMIVRVWTQVRKCQNIDKILVATDDERISNVCKKFNINFVMTGSDYNTGTDRVASLVEEYSYNTYVNVQGDEPLVNPKDIDTLVSFHLEGVTKGIEVTNGYVPYSKLPEKYNEIKSYLAKNDDDLIVNISRSPIISDLKNKNSEFLSHIGMYAFTKSALMRFVSWTKGTLEKSESIEMLRFIENKEKIRCLSLGSGSIAVDYPKDVEKVENILKGRF